MGELRKRKGSHPGENAEKTESGQKSSRVVKELFETEKMATMLKYVQIYVGSIDTEDEKDNCSKKAR